MSIRIFLFYSILIVFSLFGSASIFAQKEYYIPKALIIPIHDQKNQLHISAGRGGGYDLNLSYTVTNHLALFTAGTYDRGTKKRLMLLGGHNNIKKDDRVLKAGLGLFYKCGPHGILETYAGAGYYSVKNYWYFDIEYPGDGTWANFWNVFSQINISAEGAKHEWTAALRLSYNKYTKFEFFDGSYSDLPQSYKAFGELPQILC